MRAARPRSAADLKGLNVTHSKPSTGPSRGIGAAATAMNRAHRPSTAAPRASAASHQAEEARNALTDIFALCDELHLPAEVAAAIQTSSAAAMGDVSTLRDWRNELLAHRSATLLVLRRIDARERIVACLADLSREQASARTVARLRMEASAAQASLKQCSEAVTAAVAGWNASQGAIVLAHTRAAVSHGATFLWRGEDYLGRMGIDVAFVGDMLRGWDDREKADQAAAAEAEATGGVPVDPGLSPRQLRVQQEGAAAVRVQSSWRGHRARQAYRYSCAKVDAVRQLQRWWRLMRESGRFRREEAPAGWAAPGQSIRRPTSAGSVSGRPRDAAEDDHAVRVIVRFFRRILAAVMRHRQQQRALEELRAAEAAAAMLPRDAAAAVIQRVGQAYAGRRFLAERARMSRRAVVLQRWWRRRLGAGAASVDATQLDYTLFSAIHPTGPAQAEAPAASTPHASTPGSARSQPSDVDATVVHAADHLHVSPRRGEVPVSPVKVSEEDIAATAVPDSPAAAPGTPPIPEPLPGPVVPAVTLYRLPVVAQRGPMGRVMYDERDMRPPFSSESAFWAGDLEAATAIQRVYRGHGGRKIASGRRATEVRERERAQAGAAQARHASVIQAFARYWASYCVAHTRPVPPVVAAVRLQRWWRRLPAASHHRHEAGAPSDFRRLITADDFVTPRSATSSASFRPQDDFDLVDRRRRKQAAVRIAAWGVRLRQRWSDRGTNREAAARTLQQSWRRFVCQRDYQHRRYEARLRCDRTAETLARAERVRQEAALVAEEAAWTTIATLTEQRIDAVNEIMRSQPDRDTAAARVQRLWRGHVARRVVQAAATERGEVREHRRVAESRDGSARVVQGAWRGFQERQRQSEFAADRVFQRTVAAKRLQSAARMWAAKARLQELRRTRLSMYHEAQAQMALFPGAAPL